MARTNNYNSFPMYFTAILFQNLIIGEVARLTDAVNDWTEWELCNKSLRPNCHRFRELTCEKQGFENLGVECATGSRDNLLEVFEQQLSTGCNPINTDDITTLCLQNLLNEMPCQGHCYDAVQKVQYNCTEARGQCILSGYRRCYNPDNCLGTWSDWIPEENCSASCGGGTRSETRSCYEKNNTSYNCQRTSITNTAQSRSISCNTQACPASWSEWVPMQGENCSATCGEGVQRYLSACREGPRGNLSNLCNGSENNNPRFEHRPCTDLFPCPTTSLTTSTGTTSAIATTGSENNTRRFEDKPCTDLPLCPTTSFTTSTATTSAIATTGDDEDLAKTNFPVIAIAIVASAVVLIVLLIILLVVIMRKKKRKSLRFSHTSSHLNSAFGNQANETQHNEKLIVENAIYSQSEGVRFVSPTEVKNGKPGDGVYLMASDDAQEIKSNEIYIPLEKQMQLETQNQPADSQLYDRVQNGRNVHDSAYDSFSR